MTRDLTRAEVREKVADTAMIIFDKFMHGQGCGMAKDGSVLYFPDDVQKFLSGLQWRGRLMVT